jgi:hypothetical protein
MNKSTANNLRRPIRNALTKAAFSAWLELGNTRAGDWRGASDDVKSCFRTIRGDLSLEEARKGLQNHNDAYCFEMLAYLDAIEALSFGSGYQLALESLCQMSMAGNRRSRRVLAGLGFWLFGQDVEVPGLSNDRSLVEAAEFFLESGDCEMVSRCLLSGEWWGMGSYLCAGRMLLDMGLGREALESFRLGCGMGETGCRGYLIALEKRGERMSGEEFRFVLQAAEKGFEFPLRVAGEALSIGNGVDADPMMAKFCRTLAEEGREKKRGVENEGGFFEIIFSWAGKHPDEPIFLKASEHWRRSLKNKA